MGDCSGAGSGDWRDYEQRSSKQIEDDEYREFKNWVSRKRFIIEAWRIPVEGEYFVSDKDSRSDRKILKAECEQLYGSTKMVPLNFNEKYKYYIVKKRKKSNKSLQPTKKRLS